MTDTPETAEWEPDEPDTATDTPADTTPTDEQPATPPNPPPAGMVWDEAAGKYREAEPHNREARYRIALRDAETERDKLQQRLERRDREDVERMIAHKLADSADIWRGDVTLADVTDPESGDISPQLVDEAVARVLKLHPHWGSGINPAAPASMVTSDCKPDLTDQQSTTWQSLFEKARGDRT